MASMKFSRNKIILKFAMLLIGISAISYSWHPVQAQIIELVDNLVENLRMQYQPNEPPSRGGYEGRSRGSGTQSSCPNGNSQTESKSLIALVPKENYNGKTYVKGKTTVSNPTFWFYIPYSSKLYIELVLEDREEDRVYETDYSVEIEGKSAIIGFQLPSQLKLELGKNYYWSLLIYCDRDREYSYDSPNDFVYGWVQRVSLSSELQSQLEEANPLDSPLERIALLAQNGIWYDPLTALAQLRLENSDDETIANAWNDLLKSVELEDISQVPIQDSLVP